MRLAPSIVLVVAVTGLVAACHPRNQAERGERGQNAQSGQMEERRGGGHGLRRVCADDIAKYCQNEDRKRRCLRENLDKLSPDCKAAVQAAIERRRDNSNSGSTGNGTNGNKANGSNGDQDND